MKFRLNRIVAAVVMTASGCSFLTGCGSGDGGDAVVPPLVAPPASDKNKPMAPGSGIGGTRANNANTVPAVPPPPPPPPPK